MKTSALITHAALVAAAALLVGRAVSQDKPAKDSKPGEVNAEEMMKQWEAFATPGAAHKALESLVGEWQVESKWWMSPDAPPAESKGTTKAKWILGGRYLQEEFDGEIMGRPMKGMGITGYDNFKKKYISMWIDDAGTGMYTSQGTADKAGKAFTYEGKMDDPMTGEKEKPTKYIVRIVSKDKHTFEMFDLTKGDKGKIAEMTYTRK